ncbi:MAG: hypothetical protein HZA22_01095 [Nitrospirae bacterium]|nr:hypothetical protein [Nitrospirota bacterium]
MRVGRIGGMLMALFVVLVSASAFAGEAGTQNDGVKPKRIIHGKPQDRRAVEALLEESEGDAEAESSDKVVFKLKGKFKIDKGKPVVEAVLDFIDRHRNAFGLKNPNKELKLDSTDKHKEGDAHVYYQQTYNGVPIWSKIVNIHINKGGDIDRISSGGVPTPDIDTTPLITAEEALNLGRASLNIPIDAAIWPPEEELVIYDNTLAYKVLMENWLIFINAKNGNVISKKYIAPDEVVEGQAVLDSQ